MTNKHLLGVSALMGCTIFIFLCSCSNKKKGIVFYDNKPMETTADSTSAAIPVDTAVCDISEPEVDTAAVWQEYNSNWQEYNNEVSVPFVEYNGAKYIKDRKSVV